jgi:hypothetical protein
MKPVPKLIPKESVSMGNPTRGLLFLTIGLLSSVQLQSLLQALSRSKRLLGSHRLGVGLLDD